MAPHNTMRPTPPLTPRMHAATPVSPRAPEMPRTPTRISEEKRQRLLRLQKREALKDDLILEQQLKSGRKKGVPSIREQEEFRQKAEALLAQGHGDKIDMTKRKKTDRILHQLRVPEEKKHESDREDDVEKRRPHTTREGARRTHKPMEFDRPSTSSSSRSGSQAPAPKRKGFRMSADQIQRTINDKLKARFKTNQEVMNTAFKFMDEDCGGILTYEEFVHAMQMFNFNIPREDMMEFAKKMDRSGDGHVNIYEFINTLKEPDYEETEFVKRIFGDKPDHVRRELLRRRTSNPMVFDPQPVSFDPYEFESVLREKILHRKTGALDLRNAFRFFDSRGEGELSYQEFANALERFNINYPKEQIASFVEKYDLDGNGDIDFHEFVAAVVPNFYETSPFLKGFTKTEYEELEDKRKAKSKNAKLRWEPRIKFTDEGLEKLMKEKISQRFCNEGPGMRKAFKAFDEMKSGKISAHEFMRILHLFNINFHPEDTIQFLQRFDKNADGQIDFHEFVERMLDRDKVNKRSFIDHFFEEEDRRAREGVVPVKVQKAMEKKVETNEPYDNIIFRKKLQEKMWQFAGISNPEIPVHKIMRVYDKEHANVLPFKEFLSACRKMGMNFDEKNIYRYCKINGMMEKGDRVRYQSFIDSTIPKGRVRNSLVVGYRETPDPTDDPNDQPFHHQEEAYEVQNQRILSKKEFIERMKLKLNEKANKFGMSLHEVLAEFPKLSKKKNSNKLTYKEFGNGIKALNMGFDDRDVIDIIRMMDLERHGYINLDEFGALVHRAETPPQGRYKIPTPRPEAGATTPGGTAIPQPPVTRRRPPGKRTASMIFNDFYHNNFPKLPPPPVDLPDSQKSRFVATNVEPKNRAQMNVPVTNIEFNPGS